MDDETMCAFCDKYAEEKGWQPDGDKPTCYSHCSASTNGAHIPDMNTVQMSDGNSSIGDVWCRYCLQSGSFAIVITADDVNWE